MTEVIMPKMGDGMEEGTLLEWTKPDGADVKSGETIAMIQTDKASLELEAPGTGKLAGLLLKEGDTVPVGAPIAVILKSGESLPDGWGSGSKSDSTAEALKEVAVAANQSTTQATTEEKAIAEPVADTSASRVKASPLAKKIAKESGVDLKGVAGSGPGGRIVERDVRAASGNGTTKPAVLSKGDLRIPLNKIRQITANRTAQSKSTVPHFYATVEVDLEAIIQLRSIFEAAGEFKPSINDFVVRATALTLVEMPIVNSSYDGDAILQHGDVHLGMAVALDDGLTLPVIRNANLLTLREISANSRDLATRARENRLTLEELSGSTFSISNMGMLNVVDFGAIINQPNAGILAVASARKVVVPTEEEDEVEIRTKMNVTGSFDHRVVDGAVGAKFMNVLREFLEQPARLLS